MLRVVFDTNVYVSGLLFGGIPRQLILKALENQFELFISDEILTELSSVLAKKFKFSAKELAEAEDLIKTLSTTVRPRETVRKARWPADNRILECAVTAGADYLVSGDKRHLLPLKRYSNTTIVSPSEFWRILQGR